MINRIYGHLTKDSGDALISIFSDSLKASRAKIGLMNKKKPGTLKISGFPAYRCISNDDASCAGFTSHF